MPVARPSRPTRRTARRRVLALVLVPFVALAGLAGCSKHHGSEAAFCKEVKQVPALQSVLAGFRQADAEELQKRLDSARSTYGDLRGAAPDEISSETDDLVDLVDAVIDAVGDNPTDTKALTADLRAAVKDHPDAATASRAVARYATSHCGVDLIDGTTPTTTAAPPPTSTTTSTTSATGSGG